MDYSRKRVRFKHWILGGTVGAVAALFSFIPVAAADPDYSPSGWNVQITSYDVSSDYAYITATVPADTAEINCYLYTNDDQSGDGSAGAYAEKEINVSPDSSGNVNFFLYDLQGSGNPTYVKMTVVENGVESSLPADYWVAELDVHVWVDNWPSWLVNGLGFTTQSQTDLQNAVTNLENAAGVGQVLSAGSGLQSSINGVSGFSAPNSGDLSMTLPLTVDSSVNGVDMPPLSVTLFSASQLSQLTWLSTLRTILEAIMWITFVVYLVLRFAPVFKV